MSLLIPASVLLFAALSDDKPRIPKWAVNHGLKRYDKADKVFLRMLGEIVPGPYEHDATGMTDSEITSHAHDKFHEVEGKLIETTWLMGTISGNYLYSDDWQYNPPILVRPVDWEYLGSGFVRWWVEAAEYRDEFDIESYPDLDLEIHIDGPVYLNAPGDD